MKIKKKNMFIRYSKKEVLKKYEKKKNDRTSILAVTNKRKLSSLYNDYDKTIKMGTPCSRINTVQVPVTILTQSLK